MTVPVAGRPLRLTSTALGAVGRFLDGPSPFAVAPSPHRGLAEREAIASLLARGLLVPVDGGLELGEELRELVDAAAASCELLAADAIGHGGTSVSTAWLRGPEVAVEQRWLAPAGFELSALPRDEADERAIEQMSPTDGAALGAEELGVKPALLADASQRALAGEAPLAEAPELLRAFAAALAGGARRCSLDCRRSEVDGQIRGVRLEWIDAGEAGCWSVEHEGESATLRRLDPVELRASIADLVAPAGG